ncbi:hypothetical protein D3C80_1967650 [compost metagenome]
MGPGQKELQVPIIKIEPIEFRTEGRDTVVIIGIDPIRSSPLCGYVHDVNGERSEGRWNLKGRGSYPHLNFAAEAMNSFEFETLIEAAFHLMPRRVRESSDIPTNLF